MYRFEVGCGPSGWIELAQDYILLRFLAFGFAVRHLKELNEKPENDPEKETKSLAAILLLYFLGFS
jgi:hypothetical protein